jgi:hypothetical protein
VRIPAAIALMLGGVFAFLPILGLWMLPIGALLIGEDIPPVRRFTLHLLRHALAWWDRMHARRGDGRITAAIRDTPTGGALRRP